MSPIRWPLALLGLCAGALEAAAQVPVYASPYGVGYYTTGGVSITYGRRSSRGRLSISAGTFVRGYSLGPFGPGYSASLSRVTVIYTPPPVYVLLPPPDGPLPFEVDRRPRPEPGEPPPVPGPEDLRPPPPPPPPPPPKEKERPPPPPPKVEKRPPPQLPRPPAPEADPKAEYERLLEQGREAFRRLEYGRAAARFRQATRVAPGEPLAHFLLAQVQLALGKYHEASDAIHAGVAVAPDWPRAPFRPLELYGPHVADYPEHLARLEAALARHPDDPVLLFLHAYQLWFDGRRDEAGPAFRRALPGAADPEVVDRFLRALPPAPVL